MKRNLIYYICPFKDNGEWKKNIKTLSQYLNVFNNKLIVTIAQGEGLEYAGQVKKMFKVKNIEYIEIENNPRLGEVEPFMQMLKRVYSVDPEEITFYAHAKGVSHYHKSKKKMMGIQIWRNLMYYFCLNNINEIDAIMKNFSCCGCFPRWWPCLPWVPEPWHFSGIFYWFNHQKLFNKPNWNRIRKDSAYAVEGYLANYFGKESAYSLFSDETQKHNVDSPINYDEEKWKHVLAPHNLKISDFSDI